MNREQRDCLCASAWMIMGKPYGHEAVRFMIGLRPGWRVNGRDWRNDIVWC
jgi:hypothetical protein